MQFLTLAGRDQCRLKKVVGIVHFFALEATWGSRNPEKVTQKEVMIEEGEICSEAFGGQFIQ